MHRTGPLHAIGRHERFGNAGAHDQQAVIAQHHDVAIAEIRQQAGPFVIVPRGAGEDDARCVEQYRLRVAEHGSGHVVIARGGDERRQVFDLLCHGGLLGYGLCQS